MIQIQQSVFQAAAWCIFLGVSIDCSITDFKYRRIKNGLLCWSGCAGVVIYLFSHAFREYPSDFLIVLTGAALSFAGWRLRIWAAGDAKFFIFTSIYLILLFFSGIHRSLAAKISILILVLCNAFTAALLYVAGEAFVNLALHLIRLPGGVRLKEAARAALAKLRSPAVYLYPKMILAYMAMLIAYNLLSVSLYRVLPAYVVNNTPAVYAVMLVCFPLLRRLLDRVKITYVLLPAVLIAGGAGIDIRPVAASALKMVILFGAVMAGINSFVREKESYSMNVGELKPYCVLAGSEIKALPVETRAPMLLRADGLTPEQVKCLQTYYAGIQKERVRVCHTFPFVPFIVIGALVTWFLRFKAINIFFLLR